MKLWISVLVLLVLIIPASRWAVRKASPAPNNLYSGNGNLTPCPASPNCISTAGTDQQHRIEPPEGDAAANFSRLRQQVAADKNARIVTENKSYLHAEYRSRLLGFTDDLEVLVDSGQNKLQLRSASRLGYSDFGVNRKRMESLLKSLE